MSSPSETAADEGTVLVTGGAGYVGSHMVDLLRSSGRDVAVVDSLVNGHRDAVPMDVPFLCADVADRARVGTFLRRHGVRSILHFAALSQVAESVAQPRRYYVHNLAATIALAEEALELGIDRFVLSSTAAVYGVPETVPIDEDAETRPLSPYGETKLAIERMLASYGRAHGLRWAALRYFNAAGAEPERGLGERHDPESHLVPIVLDAALGRRENVTIHGTEYPTPDGTCVRDYVHVVDLCRAHLAALDHLARGGESGSFNLGTGAGHSVREVIDAVRRVTGADVPVAVGPPRPGDPPYLVAGVGRARTVLGWSAERSGLDQIVADAWRFHRGRDDQEHGRPSSVHPRAREEMIR